MRIMNAFSCRMGKNLHGRVGSRRGRTSLNNSFGCCECIYVFNRTQKTKKKNFKTNKQERQKQTYNELKNSRLLAFAHFSSFA